MFISFVRVFGSGESKPGTLSSYSMLPTSANSMMYWIDTALNAAEKSGKANQEFRPDVQGELER